MATRSSNTVVELTHNWDQKEPYALGTGFGHLAIGVPDVYTDLRKLAKAGVKIPRPAGPMAHGGSVIAFIEDPDGYKIELVERNNLVKRSELAADILRRDRLSLRP